MHTGGRSDVRPACQGREAIFDSSGRPDLARRALEICNSCPVLASCRSWVLTADVGWMVAGGMTARQRRTARQRAGLAEPTSPNADIYTVRQRIADATDAGVRRQLIAAAWGKLLADGVTPDEAADRLGVKIDECRRAHNAVRASHRRLTA
jgi:Transcription factor WhiB